MTIKLPEKIEIDGIRVRPYLTLQEQEIITQELLNLDSEFERKSMLVACVISACTDLLDGENVEYSYEQIVYSGIWDKIKYECKFLHAAITDIEFEVSRRESFDYLVRKEFAEFGQKIVAKLSEETENASGE